jgi:hypothetical protein
MSPKKSKVLAAQVDCHNITQQLDFFIRQNYRQLDKSKLIVAGHPMNLRTDIHLNKYKKTNAGAKHERRLEKFLNTIRQKNDKQFISEYRKK